MSDIEMGDIDADDDIDISDVKGILSGSEEGEINDTDSDDEPSHRIKDNNSSKNTEVKYSFQTQGNDSINRSIFDDVDLAKMEERAGRFGLDPEGDSTTVEKEKTGLYESLSIVTLDDIRHARLDTIHVYGVDRMKTNDIFEYFFSHQPLFLEWINESSCNVVWKDDISAARAMVFYSKEIIYEDDVVMADDTENKKVSGDGVRLTDIPVTAPPGRWRAGATHPAADFIFLRFANKSDKKASGKDKLKVYSNKYKDSIESENTELISESMKNKIKLMKANNYELEEERSKNPWGELCETWGVNDAQEVFGIPAPREEHPLPLPPYYSRPRDIRERIGNTGPNRHQIPITERLSLPRGNDRGNVKMRLGKRTQEVIDIEESSESESEESHSSDEEWRSKIKVPRMRMRADDEQEKINKKMVPSDQPGTIWEQDVGLSNIMVEVKNEIIERPSIPDEVEPRRDSRSKAKPDDLRSRIGRRRSSFNSESEESSGSPQAVVRSKQPGADKVWSRLDMSKKQSEPASSDPESQDLRHTLDKSVNRAIPKRPGFNPDLRSRLGKKSDFRASPLRIEVDNELYNQSDDE